MNKIELKNEFLYYPESLLEAWKLGDYSMLTHSKASDYIKKILNFKLKTRIGRRFFGEAYIASRIEMNEGWYNSFKWLTADKWVSGNKLDPKFEKPFYNALMKHIGIDVLTNLQKKLLIFIIDTNKDLWMEVDTRNQLPQIFGSLIRKGALDL